MSEKYNLKKHKARKMARLVLLVEARGIEPLSENQSLRFSTSVVGYLHSHHTPRTDALRNQVSFLCVITSKAKWRFTFIAT